QVAHAVPEYGEVDTGLALALDQPDQLCVVRDADVEVAVGGQDDPVDPVLDESPLGLLVGHLDSTLAVGRSPGREAVDLLIDAIFLVPGSRRQKKPRGAGVGDDAHAVAAGELLDQEL